MITQDATKVVNDSELTKEYLQLTNLISDIKYNQAPLTDTFKQLHNTLEKAVQLGIEYANNTHKIRCNQQDRGQ